MPRTADLEWDEAGSGPAILLLHAGIADRRMWDPQMEALADRYRLIRYDARGFGESGRIEAPYHAVRRCGRHPRRGRRRPGDRGRLVDGRLVCDRPRDRPPGAGIGAGRHRHRPGWPHARRRAAGRLGRGRAAYEAGDIERAIDLDTEMWVQAPDIVAQVRAWNAAIFARDESDEHELDLDPPAIDRLDEIQCPVLAVVGDRDQPFMVEGARALANGVARGRLAVMPGLTHLPSLEAARGVQRDPARLPRGIAERAAASMDVATPTSVGLGRLVVDAAETPTAVLWLGHGAGGGIEARDLRRSPTGLPARGITVARYEQPWRVAGRRVAAPPATLDVAWRETAPVVAELAAGLPVVVGGRSAGARVACRTAQAVGAAAVVCLAFPLHPPGRPEKSRLAELLLPDVPVLVLQGGRDTFGTRRRSGPRGRAPAVDPRRGGGRCRSRHEGAEGVAADGERRRRPADRLRRGLRRRAVAEDPRATPRSGRRGCRRRRRRSPSPASPPGVCIAVISASRSGTSMLTATCSGFRGSVNVRMFVMPSGPKKSSRVVVASQCVVSLTSWWTTTLGMRPPRACAPLGEQGGAIIPAGSRRVRCWTAEPAARPA